MAEKRQYACVGNPADPDSAEGTYRFPVTGYPVGWEPSVFEKRRNLGGTVRNVLRVTVEADAVSVKTAFTDGTAWYLETVSTDSEPIRYDQSSFCIAGDVVDHRNGSVTFYMAEKTEDEQRMEEMEAENARLLFEHLTGGTY